MPSIGEYCSNYRARLKEPKSVYVLFGSVFTFMKLSIIWCSKVEYFFTQGFKKPNSVKCVYRGGPAASGNSASQLSCASFPAYFPFLV